MRPSPNPNIEVYRITTGRMGSDSSFGNNGAFSIPNPLANAQFFVIASDGMGWDHVSVSLKNRCPNWNEMCYIKQLFWDDEESVMQLHPPKSKWVNNHPFCLHLWRPNSECEFIPLPDEIMVGIKSAGTFRV